MNNPRLRASAPWILATGGLLVGLTGAAYGIRNQCSPLPPLAVKAPKLDKASPYTPLSASAPAPAQAPMRAGAGTVLPGKETPANQPAPRIVEFNLPKSKHLQQVGPVRVALRKSDVNHQQYNLNLAALDGRTIEKKNVNLLEPVFISSAAGPHQSVELVVKRIEKDRVTGFLRIPE